MKRGIVGRVEVVCFVGKKVLVWNLISLVLSLVLIFISFVVLSILFIFVSL